MRSHLGQSVSVLLIAALLLFPAGAGHAAAPGPSPAPSLQAPMDPLKRVEQVKAADPPPAYTPAALMDPAMAEPGALARAQAVHDQVLQQNLAADREAAARAAAAATAVPAPAARYEEQVVPRQVQPAGDPTYRPGPSSTTAAPPPQAPVPVVTNTVRVIVEPDPADVHFTLDHDVFAAGTRMATTARITRNGLPLAGAEVWVGDLGTFTTGADGTAAIDLSAPATNTRLVVGYSYTLPGENTPWGNSGAAEIYILKGGYGVVVIDQGTAKNGDPLSRLEARLFFSYYQADVTATSYDGKAVMFAPSGNATLEIRATDAGGAWYYFHQPINIAAGAKSPIHPSGSGMEPATFSLSLDDTPLTTHLNIRADSVPSTTWIGEVGPQVYLAPGEYHILLHGQGATEQVLLPNTYLMGTSPHMAGAGVFRRDLATIAATINTADGAVPAAALEVEAWGVPYRVPNLNLPLLAFPDYFRPGRALHRLVVDLTHSYEYWYVNQWRGVTYASAGRTVSWQFGAPVRANLTWNGAAAPGSEITFQANLLGQLDDWVEMVFRTPAITRPKGTLRVVNSAGAEVFTAAVESRQGEATWQVPWTAGGGYTAALTYDHGPLGPPVSTSISVSIPRTPEIAVSFSRQLFQLNEQANVTATVTDHGEPLAGATVTLGYGGVSYTTNAAGQVTFAYTAASLRRSQPVVVMADGYSGAVGCLYTVPVGYGVVEVAAAVDQNGRQVPWWKLALSRYVETGGGNLSSVDMSRGEVYGAVVPAGLTSVEVTSNYGADGTSLYLYAAVTAQEAQLQRVTPSAVGAVPLTVTASLDGVPRGGSASLHNEAMTGASRYGEALYWPQIYVLPGQYSVTFFSGGTPAWLFTRTGVTVNGPTPLTLAEATDGLATLRTTATDGDGNPISVEARALVGQIAFTLNSNATYLASAGVGYQVLNYQHYQGGWRYFFEHPEPTPEISVPGSTLTLGLGGPLTLRMEGPATARAGEPMEIWLNLRNARGMNVTPTQDWVSPPTTLALRDGSGGVVWSEMLEAGPSLVLSRNAPATPGTYTLVADYPLGPYQSASGHAEWTVEVRPASKPILTVSPKLIPSGVATPVTVRVTLEGEPLADRTVFYDGRTVRTDARGEATVTVGPYGAALITFEMHDTLTDYWVADYAFVLNSDLAAVEVSATDSEGQIMTGYEVSASAGGYGRGSRWEAGGKAAFLLSAGPTRFDLTRSGLSAYVLNRTVTLEHGVLNTVILDGSSAVTRAVSAALDGAAVPGTIAVRETGTPDRTYDFALALDQSGTGILCATPGSYEFLLLLQAGVDQILAPLPAMDLSASGPLAFDLDSSLLGRVDVSATFGGAPRSLSLSLSTGQFNVTARSLHSGSLYALEGTYEPYYLEVQLPQQSTGKQWNYYFTPSQYTPLVVTPGSLQQLNYDLTLTPSVVDIATPTYSAGNWLHFELITATVSGWRVHWITGATWSEQVPPIHTTLTDAGGAVVHTEEHFATELSWQVPADPSSAYTITMQREMGALGNVTATATVKLRVPATVQVSHEWIPVGRTTSVRITLTRGNRPLTGLDVQVYGDNYNQMRTTDKRGTATFTLTPKLSGFYGIQFTEEDGEWRSLDIAALAPGYGVLDVEALDREGKRLFEYDFVAAGRTATEGAYSPATHRKILLEAGPVTAAARGTSASGEAYYLVASTTVPSQGIVKVVADGAATSPVTVNLSNLPAGAWSPRIMMRNKALDYEDGHILYLNPSGGPTLFATPGSYEAIVAVTASERRTLLPVAELTVGDDAVLTADFAQATATVDIPSTTPSGTLANTTTLWLRFGRLLAGHWFTATQGLAIAPGTYELVDGSFDVIDPVQGHWQYYFTGTTRLSLAEGEAHTFDLGGALTSGVKADPAVALAGNMLRYSSDIQNAHGLRLGYAYHLSDGIWWAWPCSFQITAPGYRQDLHGYSDFWISAPEAPGNYDLFHLWNLGPIGQFQATSQFEVIRLPRR